jgi:hypothetical protein
MDSEMTRHQTFKRRVRARMARTGESYTTARRQLLAPASHPFDGPPADEGLRQLLDRRRAWVQRVTGRAMDDWISILDRAGARAMGYWDLWRWLADSGHLAESGLRAAVVLTYEQHIGRRQVGQSCDGDYPVHVSRTLRGTMDDVLRRWLEHVGDGRTFNGANVVAGPAVSTTERFRYWRARLADGTRVSATIWKRPDGRISLGVQHRAFPDRAAAEACRAYWKEFLAPLKPGGGRSAPAVQSAT